MSRSRRGSLLYHSLTREVWDREMHLICFDDDNRVRPTLIEGISLNNTFQQLLIQTGLQFLNRYTRGRGAALYGLTADEIMICEGSVILPPPLSMTQNASDIKFIVRLFRGICVEVCYVNDRMNDEDLNSPKYKDLNSLLSCLDYILYRTQVTRHAVLLFEAVFAHPFFLSAHSKMSLAKDGLEYLRHLYVDEQRSPITINWRYEYRMFNQGKDYLGMITEGITENSILRRVRDFGQNVNENAVMLPHEYSGVSALMLMSNFSKHANDHRARLNLRGWTDEERCAMLVRHFPNELNDCFAFLWLSLVNTDWGKNSRLRNPYLMSLREKVPASR